MLHKGTEIGEAGMYSFGDLLRTKLGTEGRMDGRKDGQTDRMNAIYPRFFKQFL